MLSINIEENNFSAKQSLLAAVLELQRSHVETASLDARILLEHVLGISREELLMGMDRHLTPQQQEAYKKLVAERAARRPLAQIVGRREFWGAEFSVSQNTLDPRPDSETLVEAVLERVEDRSAPLSILDLGTGTGCLLLSLLRELPDAKGLGVDVSPDALTVAKENAGALGLDERVRFVGSNWCEHVEGTFDIVISNPPYIPTADIEALEPEVSRYEPRLALDGGVDGLECYRRIMEKMPHLLSARGFAALEIGIGQQRSLEILAQQNGLTVDAVKKDLGGIPRVVVINPSTI